jgi:hypothetical protein
MESGTFCTGTVIKSRRGMPPSYRNARRQKEQMVVKSQGPVMAILWSDRRLVTVLTSTGAARMKCILLQPIIFIYNYFCKYLAIIFSTYLFICKMFAIVALFKQDCIYRAAPVDVRTVTKYMNESLMFINSITYTCTFCNEKN